MNHKTYCLGIQSIPPNWHHTMIRSPNNFPIPVLPRKSDKYPQKNPRNMSVGGYSRMNDVTPGNRCLHNHEPFRWMHRSHRKDTPLTLWRSCTFRTSRVHTFLHLLPYIRHGTDPLDIPDTKHMRLIRCTRHQDTLNMFPCCRR